MSHFSLATRMPRRESGRKLHLGLTNEKTRILRTKMPRRESGRRPATRMPRRESGRRPATRMPCRESGRPSQKMPRPEYGLDHLIFAGASPAAPSSPLVTATIHNVRTLAEDGIQVGAFGTTLTARHRKRGEERQCMIALTAPYFEVQLLAVPKGAVVAVGLAQHDAKITFRELPGWIAGTVGIHSDDGGIFMDNGEKAVFTATTFTIGDVVGIGFSGGFLTIYVNRKLVFRKLWSCTDQLPRGLVGMDMPGTIVAVNTKAQLTVDNKAAQKKL